MLYHVIVDNTEPLTPGFYCHEGTTEADMKQCELGSFCPKGSDNPTKCLEGMFTQQHVPLEVYMYIAPPLRI